MLTDAGRALARAAIEVDVALERAAQTVSRLQGDTRGTVTVAAFHSAALAFFRSLLTDLAGDNQPDVVVSDHDVAQKDFAPLASEHDLVLAHRLVGSPVWPSSLRVERLLFEPLDVVMRRDHRLASLTAVAPADLRDESWVAVHEGFPLEQALAVIAGIGGTEARVRHRINEFLVAADVVAAGGAIALMPRYMVDLRGHPELVLRPLTHPGLGRHIDVLARPENLERASVLSVLTAVKRQADAVVKQRERETSSDAR